MTAADSRLTRDGVPSIEVVRDDLRFVEADAIARPVNDELGATTALLRQLEVAGGERLLSQLRPSEPLAVGSAVVTGAGDLAAELLVHGVVQSAGERASAATVRRATLSALQRAHEFRVRRLALAPFGLGAGNLDPDASAAAMFDAVAEHVRRSAFPESLVFVVETADEADAFERRARMVRA